MDGLMIGIMVMFLWGIADFLQTVTIRKLGSLKNMFLINVICTFFIFPIALWLYFKGMLSFTYYDFILVLIASIFDIVASYNFMRAFEIGEVAVVAPITASYALITAILAAMFLGEVLSIAKVLVILLIVIGVALASADIRKMRHIRSVKGFKEAMITAFSLGLLFTLMKFLSTRLNLATMFILTWFFLGIILMVFSGIRLGWHIKRLEFGTLALLALIELLFASAWLLFSTGLSISDASFLVPISSLYPAVTVMLALIFFKEKLAKNQLIGIGIIIMGLFFLSI
ncbi:MAG: DMT family transporter [Candidatus Woesearchaeota archaeon]|nr:DMT family transporter [Candidatus Woesearchaeota archaeon]